MNPMDPKFLRTHIRRPRNIKRRFSAALTPWCAWRKRGFAAGALALAPPARSLPAARVSRPLPTSLAPLRPSCGHIVRKEKAARFSGFQAENEPLMKPARGGRPSKKAAAARTPSRSSSWLVIPIHATMWPGHQRSRTPRRACDEKGRQQRAAAVNAGLGNELGSARPHQKPEQLVLDGRTSQAGEKRKQLPGQGQISFVAALFASFVCCSQMTNKSWPVSLVLGKRSARLPGPLQGCFPRSELTS